MPSAGEAQAILTTGLPGKSYLYLSSWILKHKIHNQGCQIQNLPIVWGGGKAEKGHSSTWVWNREESGSPAHQGILSLQHYHSIWDLLLALNKHKCFFCFFWLWTGQFIEARNLFRVLSPVLGRVCGSQTGIQTRHTCCLNNVVFQRQYLSYNCNDHQIRWYMGKW